MNLRKQRLMLTQVRAEIIHLVSFLVVFRLLDRSALLAAVPQAVTDLTVVDVETMAVQLAWLRPTDYKVSYSYLVAGRQTSALVQNYTTPNETFTFPNLTPGESYHFDVFTVVEGVKSEVKSISSDTSKTRPCFVTNIQAQNTAAVG